jgi:hypothetical protein
MSDSQRHAPRIPVSHPETCDVRAPEYLAAPPERALDGVVNVRDRFHVALYGALRLDIVDIYRRFRLVSLARKSIAGRVSRIPPSPELPSTELPSPKLKAAHGFCARLRLNARASGSFSPV